MSPFRALHIPPLFIATSLSIGGMMPLWNAEGAIQLYGFPQYIAKSSEAQSCFTIYGSRASMLGMAMWIFYLQGKLQAVDTILALMMYAGAVDGWVCWQLGVFGSAYFRVISSLLVGAWGLFGITARG